jgi:predicted nucleic-acid-binding Zn-ribbon protein
MQKCIKCESTDVFVRSTSGDLLINPMNPTFLGLKLRSFISPDVQICTSCGYLEFYLSEEDINKAKNY